MTAQAAAAPGHPSRSPTTAGATTAHTTGGVATVTIPHQGTRPTRPPAGHHGAPRTGEAPVTIAGGPWWPGWDIARGVATLPDGSGGYVLDAWGGLHPFTTGSHLPPAARGGSWWPGWDIARGAAFLSDGSGGYVVDAWGGLHPFTVTGAPPPAVTLAPWWPGWDVVRGVALLPGHAGGYVVDAWGGLHSFSLGGAPLPPPTYGATYWPHRDVARGIALLPDGTGGYVVDAWGGIHPFGIGSNPEAPPADQARYWPGFPIVRGMALLPRSKGLVLDAWGALHGVRLCDTVCKDGTQPTFPIRAAFYYPWFPETWGYGGIWPYTRYEPTIGFYDSSDAKVIAAHISAMRWAGIQAGIASWWGQGTKTDHRVPALLKAAQPTGFKWALYYEPEGYADPSPDIIRRDLIYIRDHYANDPNYLRVEGSFVVFAYNDPADRCEMAQRWAQARIPGVYVVLKVFPGWQACAPLANGWHQYDPATRANDVQPYSFTVSPGFFHILEPNARLSRDLYSFAAAVRDMVASGDPFQLITTFNEWGEGTAVEASGAWPSSVSSFGSYLDLLHTNGL